MKSDTKEWVAKADGDFYDAQRGVRARTYPNYDGVCFHCQQCMEKYIKGRLIEAGIEFPKIHDLARLLDFVLAMEPDWEQWRTELKTLTDYAVGFRYPKKSATRKEARQAFKICKELRIKMRRSLGLHEPPTRKTKRRAHR